MTAPTQLDYVNSVVDRLWVIREAIKKVTPQYHSALNHLGTILEELSKIYLVLDEELTSYLCLQLEQSNAKQLARDTSTLLRLEGGMVRVRMKEAGVRCKKISNIYNHYLSNWMREIFNTDEDKYNTVQALFRELAEFDSYMVDVANDTADWLTNESRKTMELVEAGDFVKANLRIIEARKDARKMRERISNAMVEIRTLQGELVDASGAL